MGMALTQEEWQYLDLFFHYRHNMSTPEPHEVIQHAIAQELYHTIQRQVHLLEEKAALIRNLEGTNDSIEEIELSRAAIQHYIAQERSETA